MQLELKPYVEAIEGGWSAKARLYQSSFSETLPCAVEYFGAWSDKLEAWNEAKNRAKAFTDNHNKSCKCGSKMVVGSY